MRTFSADVLASVAAVVIAQMDYDPLTGDISWKPGRKWAKRRSGEPLGCDDGRKGYRVIYITIEGKTRQHKAHRLAWLIYHGSWPDGEIDHINHDKTDNRICNLRVVTSAENSKNKGMNAANSSGYTGVHYCKSRKAWIGQYAKDRRKFYLGRFSSAIAASEAVRAARLSAGFHENHGHD